MIDTTKALLVAKLIRRNREIEELKEEIDELKAKVEMECNKNKDRLGAFVIK